jgi:hypothetical protein
VTLRRAEPRRRVAPCSIAPSIRTRCYVRAGRPAGGAIIASDGLSAERSDVPTTQESLAGLEDLELVQHLLALVPQLERERSFDKLADQFYYAIDEVIERFAPDVARAEREAAYRDDPNRVAELADTLARMEQRAALRKIADALRDWDVDG